MTRRMRLLFSVIFFIVSNLSNPALAFTGPVVHQPVSDQARQKMVEELDTIRNIFEVTYAPTDWKKTFSNWSLDEEIEKAQARVLGSEELTVKEFQRIVRDFFHSACDYHVGVYFHSTEMAMLPFSVRGAEGRYFISYIDHEQLSPSHCPFTIGDELIAFDGRPVQEVIAEIIEMEQRKATTMTDERFAEIWLTHRFGFTGAHVPKGPVTITVQTARGGTTSYQLIWNYFPESIGNTLSMGMQTTPTRSQGKEKRDLRASLLKLVASKPMRLSWDKYRHELSPCAYDDPNALGIREGFLPLLGKVLWENDQDSFFHAYLFEGPDRHLIGYVRIPHYTAGEEEAQEFGMLMARFEEMSDSLVIDQLNNPGGSVFFAYALTSMLTDQPLSTPRHRMKISYEDVAMAVDFLPELEEIRSDAEAQETLGETIGGYPVSYQFVCFIVDYFRFTISEWYAGRTLTTPHHLYGVDHINPHPYYRYTKPILMLTNELDFSGGDFVPAILQDNKRVTILGTRTAGAGGYVLNTHYPNRFGILAFTHTGSIAERIDNNPIENLGVTPDIEYQITQEDLQSRYNPYVEKVRETLKTLGR